MQTDRTIRPTRERRRHSRVVRAEVLDVNGRRAIPYRALGLLDAVTETQRQAGHEFHRLFQLAALDPLKAADMAREPCGAAPPCIHGNNGARYTVMAALQLLGGIGSSAGSCAWLVLGCDYSLREWSARESWKGRPMHHATAKGVLIATLDVLAQHFGLDKRAHQNVG